ncbi:MAG: hypothetical protein MUP13_15160 [Thermoanaerobaculales bacterium]|nr:hypothetical protein [Thermoanaerobaculales bacterium]
MAERQAREAELGRKLGGRKPKRGSSDKGKTRQVNTTDPDSRMLRARNRFVQGYNAQAAVTEDHIVVAAEVCNAANDSTQFQAMVAASYRNLADVDAEAVDAIVADAGYWNPDNVTLEIAADVLIAPMPATAGITDPTDPRIAQRKRVVERWIEGTSPR